MRSRSLAGRTASGLYGSIVTQAREPAFYTEGGVPDTMEGRFGMIGVHLFLLLERIRSHGEAGQPLGRAMLEAFMTDMDDNMREIGIGDMVVPRRVKKAAAALHEQVAAYRAAITDADPAVLAGELAHHVYLDRGTGAPDRLAAYMRRAAVALDRQPWPQIVAGEPTFPPFGG